MALTQQLFELDSIQLQAHVGNWREAVRLGVDLLVRAGTVESRYYDAIVRKTEDIGTWYILAPGIAMPHSRPEDGVIQGSFALVTLAEPVNFGDPDNDPIDILLTLAAADTKTMNEGAIGEVLTLFESEDTIERIRQAKNKDELKALFESLGLAT